MARQEVLAALEAELEHHMALAMAAVDAVEATHGIGWPAPVVQMLCGGATWLGARGVREVRADA